MSHEPGGRIPANDPHAEYAAYRGAIDEGIGRVIAEGQFTLGREVAALEAEVAGFLGARHGVAVASGTAALHLAVRALGVGPGDEVLTVANTDAPTAAVVRLCGATVRFVDVDPRTLTMDPAALAAAVTPRARAVLPVHLHGLPADMDPILELARRHGLLVLEDAALAFGTRYGGRYVGALGDAGALSFSPSKILTAFGDAGMVLTGDVQVAERIRGLRAYGHGPRTRRGHRTDPTPGPWEIESLGLNERMDDLQAAVVRAKLAGWAQLDAGRKRVAERYRIALADLPVSLPEPPPGAEVVYRAFPILVDARDRVHHALVADGIAARQYYQPPLHRQPAFADLGYRPGDLPGTDEAAERVLCLPVFPHMTDSQVDDVVASLRAAIRGDGVPSR